MGHPDKILQPKKNPPTLVQLPFHVITSFSTMYFPSPPYSGVNMKQKHPVFKTITGGITAASGFLATSTCARIKESKKEDIGIIVSQWPCTAAGAFTTNKVRAACVDWSESILPSASVRAIFCNSGNANACTGKQGEKDVAAIAATIGENVGVEKKEVLVASTGVIGHFLPMEKITRAIPIAIKGLSAGKGAAFAKAIMTTDTVSKEYAIEVPLSKGVVRLGGACKGSGMIHPNMATMLAFVTSDAIIDKKTLNAMVKYAVERTFNNLSVDGDTSTNDMLLALANGASGISVASSADKTLFASALVHLCDQLCQKIAADGEGATKRVEVSVSGAKTIHDARKVINAISTSALVKTALFGNDPNWGRILCAIGYSGADFSKNKIKVALNGTTVFEKMRPAPFNAKSVSMSMKKPVVYIDVDLGLGEACAIGQTCDFSYDYVKINAEYHT